MATPIGWRGEGGAKCDELRSAASCDVHTTAGQRNNRPYILTPHSINPQGRGRAFCSACGHLQKILQAVATSSSSLTFRSFRRSRAGSSVRSCFFCHSAVTALFLLCVAICVGGSCVVWGRLTFSCRISDLRALRRLCGEGTTTFGKQRVPPLVLHLLCIIRTGTRREHGPSQLLCSAQWVVEWAKGVTSHAPESRRFLPCPPPSHSWTHSSTRKTSTVRYSSPAAQPLVASSTR